MLERVHTIHIFRQQGCVCVKWKQYMTSDSWSRPIVLIPPHLMQTVAALRPQRVPQAFRADFVTANLAWLQTLEVMLAESGSGNHREDLA